MAEKLAGIFFKNDDLFSPLSQEGDICGVGVHLALVHDPPMYGRPRPGTAYRYITIVSSTESKSPAERAGLKAGDIILEVDDTDLDDRQRLFLPDDVADMIRGPEGSEVAVVVERRGRKMRFLLIRAPVGDQTCAAGTNLVELGFADAVPVTP
jgi:C-terminal processing protease CtpA/Prc